MHFPSGAVYQCESLGMDGKWFDLDLGPRHAGWQRGRLRIETVHYEPGLLQLERTRGNCCGCCNCFANCCEGGLRLGIPGMPAGGVSTLGLVGAVVFLVAFVAIVLLALLVLSLDGFESVTVDEYASGPAYKYTD